jgi:uncharacterized protein YjiS (DUF1127 family)
MRGVELCAMTDFPLGITRSLEWFEVHFLRWRRSAHLQLEDDSDEELKDIGIEPRKRDRSPDHWYDDNLRARSAQG